MTTKPQYGKRYQAKRRRLLEADPWCRYCGAPATIADHVPPLALHQGPHSDDGDCCVLVPSCKPCSDLQGRGVRDVRQQLRRITPDHAGPAADAADLAGMPADHPCWRVPWLRRGGLLMVPPDATWPRFMSAPHPRAVDSLGQSVVDSAADHGVELRWWQRLTLARLLEVDADGELCWSEALLSTPRRAGKSWLLRELAWWRMVHGREHFGEAQTVLHTSRTLKVTTDVAGPALRRAADLAGHGRRFKVVRALGREQVSTHLGDAWHVLAPASAYGFGAGLAICDEAWDYPPDVVVEGIQPTMLERNSPQLLIVSTAHRRATKLLPDRRRAAIAELASPTRRLLVEWSAPTPADPEHLLDAARAAAPVWDRHRARLVADALADALAEPARPGEVDPVDMFASQYVNDWSAGRLLGQGKGAPLVEAERWAEVEAEHLGPAAVVAVEDYYGQSYAVAWASSDVDSLDVVLGGQVVGDTLELRRLLLELGGAEVLAGASIAEDAVFEGLAAIPVGQRETRPALAGLRRAVAEGRCHQDGSPDLAGQMADVRVVGQAGGLGIVAGHRSDVLRAAAWCLARIEAGRLVGPAVY